MNSIDGVLARIQEILTRIQEIRDTQGRVQGTGPSAAAGVNAPQQPVPPTTTPASANQGTTSLKNSAQFQQLLQQALSLESSGIGSLGSITGTGSAANSLLTGGTGGLGGLTNLGNLDSILGNGTTATGQTSTALQQYQKELSQALQQLAAQKKQGST